jgi:hypothetical protein
MGSCRENDEKYLNVRHRAKSLEQDISFNVLILRGSESSIQR